MQMNFGKNIKKIRNVHSLSQQVFADIFELKRGTLGAYEEGRSNPKLETVLKIANHFSIGIEELLTGELTVNRLIKFNERITTEKEVFPKNEFEGIPCVLTSDKNHFIANFSKTSHLEKYPLIKLPYIECTNRIAFSVDDLSMTGGSVEFFPKDIVIAIESDLNKIEDKSLVMVLTKDELLFRRLSKQENQILLKADHHGVPDVILKYETVLCIWKIEHVFHHAISSKSLLLENRLATLEERLAHFAKK